jgi:hypothetical protein
MAMIHVNRSGTSLGVFSEEDVSAGLRSGRFAPTDLGWREGMAQWQPLSQFTEFATDLPSGIPPVAEPIAPGAAPPPAGARLSPPDQVPETRTGLPWEHRESRGFFNGFAETLLMVLTKPDTAFSVMRREGGYGDPLLYAVIGGGIGAIVGFLFSLVASSLGIVGTRRGMMGAMMGMTPSVAGLIFGIVMVAIAPFIWAALVHVSLMLLGGAKQSFETTFRVISFAQGSTAPLQLVPCCGGLIALVWNIVANCIGMARAHEIDTGRATLAVLLPLILCCGGVLCILFLFGGLAALTSHNWH